MDKIFLYLILPAIFLSSCTTASEREKIYRADYYKYSCPQLYQKYNWIKHKFEEERTLRVTSNAASAMIEVLDPARPRVPRNQTSYKEYDYEIQMKAIENVAIDKHCEGVSF